MSARKFKFISPGIFINEIDKSFTNRPSDAVGPAIVGLASKGPALRPIKVNNFQEFQEIHQTNIGLLKQKSPLLLHVHNRTQFFLYQENQYFLFRETLA